MIRIGWLSILIIGAPLLAAQAQDLNSLATEAMPEDAVLDEGTLYIDGPGSFARTEDFVFFKRPDGGYSIVSTVFADDGSYNATASWTFDKQWRPVSASGRSTANGTERKIEIRRRDNEVTISRRTAPKDAEMKLEDFTAPCPDDCLIDMSPAALPMTVMTRRYDTAKGGSQVFKWVGASLIADQILLDGVATISPVGEVPVRGILGRVTHWRFIEELKDPASGQAYQMHAHLWTDTEQRLRKFGMGRTPKPSTIGIRATDEDVSDQMPAE